jgi:hypothetical protein
LAFNPEGAIPILRISGRIMAVWRGAIPRALSQDRPLAVGDLEAVPQISRGCRTITAARVNDTWEPKTCGGKVFSPIEVEGPLV